MTDIDRTIQEMEGDISSLERMNNVLYEQWHDIKSELFDKQCTSQITTSWQGFQKNAIQHSTVLQKIEKTLGEMAQELKEDAKNAQRLDI